ncbi:aspartate aminotransferase [Thalassobius vesicularis]|uniref:Aspartate aminotransferase n=1 Tax=Thalassobius vesicularis TaxID=1294297 RepID=A0A4S3MCB1_9RHOB|nr:aspartate aminotransferase [Thalassobius vesicularis]
MQTPSSPLTPDVWLNDLFTSKSVMQGGVIRRKARDIERYAGMRLFLAEVERRGYQAFENAGQVVILCNQGPVRWLTAPRPPRAVPLSFKESGPKSFKDFGGVSRA